MEIVSATASGISVSGAVVKVGTFFSKHTTRWQVRLGESHLSICIAILDENQVYIDKKELGLLLERYDVLIRSCDGVKRERWPMACLKAHQFSEKTEELLLDARRSSDAARRLLKFTPTSDDRPENVLPNRGGPLSPPVTNSELEDVFGTVTSRKGSKDDKVGKIQPAIPPGLPIRLDLYPGRQSSASWRTRLIPGRRDSRVAGPSTAVPYPILTTTEQNSSQQTSMDLCRSPSISSSVFWNGHTDTDSGI